MAKLRYFSVVVTLIFLVGCATEPITPPSHEMTRYDELSAVEAFYGVDAKSRVHEWRTLENGQINQPISVRLAAANDFFNRLKFEDDIAHWGAEDFWATPLETVATNGGDCEDFALGKYFTLLTMGVPAQCLRLTYVKALGLNQAHMVLSYQCSPDDITLVLDNLNPNILPAAERSDLIPVYSFNANGLWLDSRDQGVQPIGDAANLSRWQALLKRVDEPLNP